MQLFSDLGPRRKHVGLLMPTQADFEKYRGGHTPKKWAQVGPDWCCPSCKRTKFEQLTWTIDKKASARAGIPVYGWLAPIVEHHDHGTDEGRSPRFSPMLICTDCNLAEGLVRRMLKLPSDFSFSPDELSTFITGHPHRRVTEDLEIARKLANVIIRLRLW